MDATNNAQRGREVKTDRRILHICVQQSPESDIIESTLAELNVACKRVGDCYAGMAELVGQDPHCYEAVLVALGGLTSADEEFFRIAGRRYRSSPIYVYGPDSGTITAKWAVQAGARRRTDAATIREMFQSRQVTPPESRPAEPEAARLDDLLVESIARPVERQPAKAEPDQDPADLQQDGEGFQPGEIEVRRSESAHTRQKPQPASATPASVAEGTGALVTPEELDALLGDRPDDSNITVSGEDK